MFRTSSKTLSNELTINKKQPYKLHTNASSTTATTNKVEIILDIIFNNIIDNNVNNDLKDFTTLTTNLQQFRWPDSRKSPDSCESPEGSRTEPLLCKSRFTKQLRITGLKWFVRIARTLWQFVSRESIRANRPDSRCESPGHPSTATTRETTDATKDESESRQKER